MYFTLTLQTDGIRGGNHLEAPHDKLQYTCFMFMHEVVATPHLTILQPKLPLRR